MTPKVTIGIPTYSRPDLLARALASACRQDYDNLEVVVSDNASPGERTRLVVHDFTDAFPRLRYVRHESNIGALANFRFLLDQADGPYFMWLADDDEISPNYVRSLVSLLEEHPRASCGAGHWFLMSDPTRGRLMPTSSFPDGWRLARAARFVWRTDDAFFYGMHRTAVLRKASFRGYWRADRWGVQNWAYVFLLDVVLHGSVLLVDDPSVRFVNHDYTLKEVLAPVRRNPLDRAARRLNVHFLYWEKCLVQMGPLAMPVIVAASLLSMLREGVWIVARRLGRTVPTGSPPGRTAQ